MASDGLALFALMTPGYNYWPAIFAEALAANFMTGAPMLVASGIAVSNTSEALLATLLLRRIRFAPSLTRVRDVWAFMVLSTFVSTLLCSIVGVTCLAIVGLVSPDNAGERVVPLKTSTGDNVGSLYVHPRVLFV